MDNSSRLKKQNLPLEQDSAVKFLGELDLNSALRSQNCRKQADNLIATLGLEAAGKIIDCNTAKLTETIDTRVTVKSAMSEQIALPMAITAEKSETPSKKLESSGLVSSVMEGASLIGAVTLGFYKFAHPKVPISNLVGRMVVDGAGFSMKVASKNSRVALGAVASGIFVIEAKKGYDRLFGE